MSNNRHTINSIHATINCGKNELEDIRRRGVTSDIENALEALSPVLDKKFDTKKMVRVASLTVELTIDQKRLSELDKLLTEALLDIFSKLGQEDHALPQTLYRKAKVHTPEEVFLYFLKNGRMPWFSAKLELENNNFTESAFQTQFTELLKSSPSARERFVEQTPDKQLWPLLSLAYRGSYVKALFEFTELISRNMQRYSERFGAGFRIRQKLIKAALDDIQESPESKRFIDFLKNYWSGFIVDTEKYCNGQHRDFLEFLRRNSDLSLDFELPPEKNSGFGTVPENDMISTESQNSIPAEEKKLEKIFKEEKSEAQQTVVNAGIVLLHPFIKRFFEKVGLLENDRFISSEHQQRGVCLLHHLATGETVFPEEKLILQKHFCNYPVQKPVPKELPISEFELTEAKTVLEAAITHWKALKQTSVDGLRVNFLKRKGLLEKDTIGYTLHVETHVADILLDQLPWGISAVHFPWLPQLLTIKWR